jgi:predicted permease
MSLWSRIANVVRGDRLSREIDEEIQSHLEEAVEQGRDPAEARRDFGPVLLRREESRDIRMIAWLESLRADAVFGWRQVMKRKVTSAAAILSLALAIGACTSAFRLTDALLLRPLPVAEPERLYALSHVGAGNDGKPQVFDNGEYPLFREMRIAVKDQAELIGVSYARRTDLTYGSDQDTEKAYLQYVSGWMFGSFGLQPSLGRLFTENDDLQPGAHPYAVLSHDYWKRRFGHDPRIAGRAFRMGNKIYTIVGVCEERFTGTQPGTVTDIFIPTMMHPSVTRPDSGWVGTWVRLKPGVAAERVRQELLAVFRTFREERAKTFGGWPKHRLSAFINEAVSLDPIAAGVSRLQRDYRRPLVALGVLVTLLLLIACANVANLMTAQAAARAREMALRVSIGAGRPRLVQLVLVESAWLALLAAGIGGWFAWWSAPVVMGMISPANSPIRLALPADWRVLGFGAILTFAVMLLFGLGPAWRAAGVKPASALKGGDDPHSRRRTMHALIAAQVALCFLVLFVAGLFVATFDRLTNQPTGFSAARLLTLDTECQRAQQPAYWEQVAERLRAVPGVERVALAGWPLLTGSSARNFISINGTPPSEDPASFLNVSPGWMETMKIALIAGRDFRAGDRSPGAAIVNQVFAKEYFNGEDPIGKVFMKTGERVPIQVVGMVGDVRYRDIREAVPPIAYVPVYSIDAQGTAGTTVQATFTNDLRGTAGVSQATFIVRTFSRDPLALAETLRREVARTRPEFRVSNILTQQEINESQTIRERVLAALALFFAAVALLLAGIGLYGVLDYSVLQRRREIGIRVAIGARASDIVWRVTAEVSAMVMVGALTGLALGMASVRYIEMLLYRVGATDLAVLALPSLAILATASLAALPGVIRALRISPATILRSE